MQGRFKVSFCSQRQTQPRQERLELSRKTPRIKMPTCVASRSSRASFPPSGLSWVPFHENSRRTGTRWSYAGAALQNHETNPMPAMFVQDEQSRGKDCRGRQIHVSYVEWGATKYPSIEFRHHFLLCHGREVVNIQAACCKNRSHMRRDQLVV